MTENNNTQPGPSEHVQKYAIVAPVMRVEDFQLDPPKYVNDEYVL